MRLEFECIERPLRNFFYAYAKVVARRPWPFVILPVIFTALCTVGFYFRESQLDAVYLYTPTNAPSKQEQKIVTEMFPVVDGNFQPEKVVNDERRCTIIVTASDGGSLLREDYGKAVEELNNYVINTIKIFVDGQEYGFEELCMQTSLGECWKNPTVRFVNGLLQHFPKNVTYPQIYFGNKFFYIASTLANVTLKNRTNLIDEARAWQLIYQLRYQPANISRLSGLWEQEFLEAMSNYNSSYLTITYIHSQTLNEELLKNADKISPKFAITFIVLVVFAMTTTLSTLNGKCRIDWVVSKPILAFLGVINAAMGVLAGIGFLNFCRYQFNDIVSVVPFLIVSICVEYTFLMNGAWRRTNRLHSVEDRLAESVSIHAVSIVIAMGTGALSCAVGAITTIPGVQIFCVYCCICMLFAMIFQFTFFTGLLALFGHMEKQGKHSLLLGARTIPEDDAKDARLYQQIWLLGSVPDLTNTENPKNYTTSLMDSFFENIYAPFLMNTFVKIAVGVLFLIYLAVGLYGCSKLKLGLRPVNLLVGDSYAVSYYNAMEQHLLPYGQVVQIVIGNATSLQMATPTGRQKINQVISAFAETNHTVGMPGVQFFLTEYLQYLKSERLQDLIARKPASFNQILRNNFLTMNAFNDWATDIIWDVEDPYLINSFRFSVGLKNFVSSNDQVETMQLLRGVASKYPELNITTYMFLWQFADQYRLVLPNTLENIGIALGLMLIISAALIPHPLCSFCIAVTIVAIDIGVVGYMALWNVNLDTVSMITIIMSVGFSVDFTAHVSYGYVVLSHEDDPVKRMQVTLGARGWPVTQACLATIVGILALSTVPAYMIVTFFKTVFLVMVIGLVHAVIFLPVMLDVMIRPVLAFTKALSKSKQANKFTTVSDLTKYNLGEPPGLFSLPQKTPSYHPDSYTNGCTDYINGGLWSYNGQDQSIVPPMMELKQTYRNGYTNGSTPGS